MAEAKFHFYSNVSEEGKLQKNVSLQIAESISHFKNKSVEIIVKRKSAKRSDRQNRYWWVLVTILSSELGYTKEEMHEILKYKFLKREKVDQNTGLVFEYLGSTAELNKMEFADLTTEMKRWAQTDLDILLPDPGEQTEFNL